MAATHDRMQAQLTQFSVEAAAEAMFTVSPQGVILNVNRTACQRLEYSREELIGMTVGDVDPHYPDEMWPQHFNEMRQVGQMRFQTQHRSKSGKLFDVEVSVAYFEFEGAEYCCSFVRDVTKQNETEHLLRLQREILSRIASTASDLSKTLSELCRLVEELVPGAMVTVMLSDKTDGNLRFAAGPALTPRMCNAFEPMIPTEHSGSCGSAAFLRRPVIVEDTRVSPHWQYLQGIVNQFNLLACWSYPILDEQEQVLGTFAISHNQVRKPGKFHADLLETATNLATIAIRRAQAEEQVQVAHNELAHVGRLIVMGTMASSISHELNQPLAALVNEAFVLKMLSQRDPTRRDTICEHAESIHEQAMRAAEIVNSMRSLARKTAPSRKRICVGEIISKSLVLMEPEIRRSGTLLKEDYAASTPAVDVDEVQIQQVLVNLVRNAIESMREVPRSERILSITALVNDLREVELRVADTGPGIATQTPESVFDAFHTTKPEGMGMGLAISRSIAIAHGGRLTVTEVQPRGAQFSLFIPLSNDKQGCKAG